MATAGSDMWSYTEAVRRVQTSGADLWLRPHDVEHAQGHGEDPEALFVHERMLAAWMQACGAHLGVSMEARHPLPLQVQAALCVRHDPAPTVDYRDCCLADLVDAVPLMYCPHDVPRDMPPFPCHPAYPPNYQTYAHIVNDVLPACSWTPGMRPGQGVLPSRNTHTVVAGGAARAWLDGMWPSQTRDLDVWVVKTEFCKKGPHEREPRLLVPRDRLHDLIDVTDRVATMVYEAAVACGVSACTQTHIQQPHRNIFQITGADDFKVDIIPVLLTYRQSANRDYLLPENLVRWEASVGRLLRSFDMPSAQVAYHPLHRQMLVAYRRAPEYQGCTDPDHAHCRTRQVRYERLFPFYTRRESDVPWCYSADTDDVIGEREDPLNELGIKMFYHI